MNREQKFACFCLEVTFRLKAYLSACFNIVFFLFCCFLFDINFVCATFVYFFLLLSLRVFVFFSKKIVFSFLPGVFCILLQLSKQINKPAVSHSTKNNTNTMHVLRIQRNNEKEKNSPDKRSLSNHFFTLKNIFFRLFCIHIIGCWSTRRTAYTIIYFIFFYVKIFLVGFFFVTFNGIQPLRMQLVLRAAYLLA